MNKFVSLVGGVVIGSLMGAAAVLLLTPKAGGDIRANIRHEVDSILEEGRRASRMRREELEGQLAQMRGDITQPEQNEV